MVAALNFKGELVQIQLIVNLILTRLNVIIVIPIWLQLKLEMEISKLKKDLKEKDNVIEEKEEEMYLLNEKLEQLKVPPIIPQQSIIKDSINCLPPVFLKLNEENNLTAPPSTLQSESAHLLSIIFFLNYGISLSLNNLLSCYNNALSLTYS